MRRNPRRVLLAVIFVATNGILSHGQLLPEKTTKPKPASPTTPTPRRNHTKSQPVIVEPEMVLIPAGEFRMGSDDGRDDEKPVHTVYVSEYSIAKCLVTNADYKSFVDATRHRAPAGQHKGGPLWDGRSFPASIARQPVVKVSWADATAYCQWLSRVTGKHYMLPTEGEWEKAARGGLDQKKYPWGDEEPDERKAWFGKVWNDYPTLKDVDYGLPNAYDLYGMAGNVSQWVADLYSAHFDVRSTSRDPQGPFEGVRRVVRGGLVSDQAERLRCASRNYRFPSDRALDVGFRVVRK